MRAFHVIYNTCVINVQKTTHNTIQTKQSDKCVTKNYVTKYDQLFVTICKALIVIQHYMCTRCQECTLAYFRGHGYGNTPELWGLFSKWGHFRVPGKKVPLNRVFMVSKPYYWGRLKSPHKLVKNIHKLGSHK